MINLSISFDKIRDIVLVTGDRAMFVAALTAAYMKIAVAHIQLACRDILMDQ